MITKLFSLYITSAVIFKSSVFVKIFETIQSQRLLENEKQREHLKSKMLFGGTVRFKSQIFLTKGGQMKEIEINFVSN